jgi:TetR/AcrR family fatty acid metabolism transcriptional regulator
LTTVLKKESKKDRILSSAVDIFREKGKNTTISEIGKKAGVTDSIIYHYFKNKEDLLFYSAGEQVKTLTVILNDHLANFHEPVNRLREFMWLQLHYHDKHPNYTNLTIFECRSKKLFFHHESFRYFRDWTRILKGILIEGMNTGVFRNDLFLPVVRDAIFGLLDMESIHSLAAGETKEAHPDIDDIMTLILPMICRREQKKENEWDKARRIRLTAERIFAEKGYDGTTTLDISKAAGVAEGTLYEYFKNKEDLLFSTIGNRLETHLGIFKEISTRQSPLRRLKQMIQHHFFLYLSQPGFMKVFIFEGLFNKRFYKSSARRRYCSYVSALYPVLDQGKKNGSIRPEINNRIFKNLFMGIVGHITLRWHFRQDDPNIDKFSEINEAVSLLIRAVSLKEDSED